MDGQRDGAGGAESAGCHFREWVGRGGGNGDYSRVFVAVDGDGQDWAFSEEEEGRECGGDDGVKKEEQGVGGENV